MSIPLKKLLLLVFLLTIISRYNLVAQARFTATISPSSIGKNETAELRLMIENARQVDQIIPPPLQDFIVLSGPNQESGMENNNGVTKQYIGITYLLRPKRKGNFSIEPATAKADGKILKTNRISLEVTNSLAVNNQNNNSSPFNGLSVFDEPVQQTDNRDFILKKGENIQAKIDKNIFIKVVTDKTSCYIGEPIVVIYKLYTRLKSESSITKNPSFNGFSVIDLSQPGSSSYNIEKLNGREYNVYTLRKSQLYPLQAGAMELESAEVENNIQFIKESFLKSYHGNGSDLADWGSNGITPEALQEAKATLQSKPVVINVKPFPDSNKPASFKGAVGNFILDATVEKNNFSTNDAGKYQLVLKGQGNMDLINTPEISWPGGIEPYEPQLKESLNKQAVPVSGSKIFEYPFTVTKAGTYTLPPIEYSYFDAGQAAYKILTTKPIVIVVTKGTGKAVYTKNNSTDKAGKESFFDTIFANRLWIIIPVILIIFAGLFFWIKKENSKEMASAVLTIENEAPRHIINEKELRDNPLSNTEDRLVQHDSMGFYEALNKEIRKFLAAQLSVPVETINKKRIAEELDKKGVAINTSLQIQQLLNDIEWQLYTPLEDKNKMQDMYQIANTIVHSFNAPPLKGEL